MRRALIFENRLFHKTTRRRRRDISPSSPNHQTINEATRSIPLTTAVLSNLFRVSLSKTTQNIALDVNHSIVHLVFVVVNQSNVTTVTGGMRLICRVIWAR